MRSGLNKGSCWGGRGWLVWIRSRNRLLIVLEGWLGGSGLAMLFLWPEHWVWLSHEVRKCLRFVHSVTSSLDIQMGLSVVDVVWIYSKD